MLNRLVAIFMRERARLHAARPTDDGPCGSRHSRVGGARSQSLDAVKQCSFFRASGSISIAQSSGPSTRFGGNCHRVTPSDAHGSYICHRATRVTRKPHERTAQTLCSSNKRPAAKTRPVSGAPSFLNPNGIPPPSHISPGHGAARGTPALGAGLRGAIKSNRRGRRARRSRPRPDPRSVDALELRNGLFTKLTVAPGRH